MVVMVHDRLETARIVASKEVSGQGRARIPVVVALACDVDEMVASVVAKLERMADPMPCTPS